MDAVAVLDGLWECVSGQCPLGRTHGSSKIHSPESLSLAKMMV